MEDATILSCVAIMAIVVLDAIALGMGIDGQLLILCCAAIAGLAGYELKAVRG